MSEIPEFNDQPNLELNEEQMQVNARYYYEYLTNQGWTLNAIAGALGNWEAESTINPSTWEDRYERGTYFGDFGYGIAQWTPFWGKKGFETAQSQRNYHGHGDPTYGRWLLDQGYAFDDIIYHDRDLQLEYLCHGYGGWQNYYSADYPEKYPQFIKSQRSAADCAIIYYRNYERSPSGSTGSRPAKATKWFNFLWDSPDPPPPPVHITTPMIILLRKSQLGGKL